MVTIQRHATTLSRKLSEMKQTPQTGDAPPTNTTHFRYAQATVWVIFLGALVLLAWQLSDVLLLLFGAIIVAVALRGFAAPVQRYLKLSARWAVVATTLILLVLIGVGVWLAGERLAQQTEDLRQRVPDALNAAVTWARGHPIGVAVLGLWDSATADDVPWSRVANAATQTLSALGSVGLVAVVGLYLATDPQLYRAGVVRLMPPNQRERIEEALLASGQALSRWLLGQGVSMLFVGSATALGLWLLGVPLALTIGAIAAVLAFIPFFGPIASGILAVLMAFMEGPTQALYVAGLCVAIQQIEGNLLMPFVQRWAVALPPVLGIMAAVIFGLLFGLAGVILATPLMVVAMVLVQKLYVEGVLEAGGTHPR